MKPDKAAVPANEHVRGDSRLQFALSTRYWKHHRVRLHVPGQCFAGLARVLCARVLKRREDPLEVVLTAVPFHDSTLSQGGGSQMTAFSPADRRLPQCRERDSRNDPTSDDA
jgi:hypothetical protein